jgi:hypothetical protein
MGHPKKDYKSVWDDLYGVNQMCLCLNQVKQISPPFERTDQYILCHSSLKHWKDLYNGILRKLPPHITETNMPSGLDIVQNTLCLT